MIGEVIDEKYRITRMIGEGGMGAVFEGENLLISRRVAIKVLHSSMALNEETVERFQREARAAGKIGNDHILEVLDLGKLPNGDHYMVLEYLDGEPLSSRIQRLGKLTPEQLAPLMTQLLTGLGAAHQAGIIHRDLKPDNVFILKEKAGRPDYVKIIDFGISKFNPMTGDEAQKKMTQTGAIMGTPYYMSPEQARGSLEADARSDLYSVGVIMYEALTGDVPFDGQTINELMFAIALNEPRPLDEVHPGLDPAFKAIVEKAMKKSKDERYQSAAEFEAAIDAWQGNEPAAAAAPVAEQPATPPPEQPTLASATSSTWSKSQADVVLGRSNTPIVAATVIGSLVMLGGVGYGAYSLLGGGSDSVASPSPDPSVTEPVEATPTNAAALPSVTPAVASSDTESKDEPAEGEKTEDQKTEDEEGDAERKEAVSQPATKSATKPAVAPKPAPRTAPRPTPKPRVAPRPPPAPKQEPKKSSASRFGY